jgi:hypothetical protein
VSTLRHDNADTPEIRRYDRIAGDVVLRPSATRPDGALLCEGVVAREGVLVYRRADGSERRELVTPEALDSMCSTIGRASVTLEHPDEGMVDPTNFGALGVGDVDGRVEVERDEMGGFVRVKLAVRRKDALDAVRGGKIELSPGYRVVTDETPGEHDVFGRYDARQIAREANHLAIVDRARGGSTVRLRADSADGVMVGTLPTPGGAPAPHRSLHMKPLLVQLAALLGVTRIDSEEAVLADLQPAAQALKAKADKADASAAAADVATTRAHRADADLVEMRKKLDEMTAERDLFKKKVDEAEAEAAKAAEKTDSDRLDAIGRAIAVKLDGLDRQGKRKAIAAHQLGCKVETLANRSDAYLDAVIDLASKAVPTPGIETSDPFRGDGNIGSAERLDDFYNPYLSKFATAQAEV